MMEENYLKSFHKLTKKKKIQKLVSLNLFDESLNTPTPASVFDHIIEKLRNNLRNWSWHCS